MGTPWGREYGRKFIFFGLRLWSPNKLLLKCVIWWDVLVPRVGYFTDWPGSLYLDGVKTGTKSRAKICKNRMTISPPRKKRLTKAKH